MHRSSPGMQGELESAIVKLDTDGYICFGLACLGGLLDARLLPSADIKNMVQAVRALPRSQPASLIEAQ